MGRGTGEQENGLSRVPAPRLVSCGYCYWISSNPQLQYVPTPPIPLFNMISHAEVLILITCHLHFMFSRNWGSFLLLISHFGPKTCFCWWTSLKIATESSDSKRNIDLSKISATDHYCAPSTCQSNLALAVGPLWLGLLADSLLLALQILFYIVDWTLF